MTLGNVFQIGSGWASALRARFSRAGGSAGAETGRGLLSQNAEQAAPPISISSSATTAVDVREKRETLEKAARALRASFDAFSPRTSSIITTTVISRATTAAPIGATATSTVRQSSSALGLNLSTAASSLSSSALGLDVSSAESASSLTSTGEISPTRNTNASSTLNFTGGGAPSTSVGTLSGTYTGTGSAANATSLTVDITKNATLNPLTAVNVRFQVTDQNGTVLFTHNANIKAGDQVSLGADIGLSISFSAGTLTNNHTASTAIVATNPDVNGDAIFNDADPSLRPQFEGGAQVTAGSFTVNGATIAVNASDTINQVLSRINASAAGVTATLANDHITLTSTANSEDAIVFASDSSGFLSATKLLGATTTRGNVRDDLQVFSKTSQFATVTDGSFRVNGQTITVDADADSVSTIVSKINSAGAGVTASYNSATDKIELVTTAASGDQITVDNDTTGLLSSAGLASNNTVRGKLAEDQQTFAIAPQFSGVTTGSFTVNGVTIAVNRDTDTLQSVIARVNASNAGVTASYDSTADKVVFTPDVEGAALSIDDDTSGFLAAADIASGTVTSGATMTLTSALDVQTSKVVISNSSDVAARVARAVQQVNDAIATLKDGEGAAKARTTMTSGLDALVQQLQDAGVDGLNVTLDAGWPGLAADATVLAASLDKIGEAAPVDAAVARATDRFAEQAAAAAAAAASTQKPLRLVRHMPLIAPPQSARPFRDPMDSRPAAAAGGPKRAPVRTAAVDAGTSLTGLTMTTRIGQDDPLSPILDAVLEDLYDVN